MRQFVKFWDHVLLWNFKITITSIFRGLIPKPGKDRKFDVKIYC